MWFVVGVAEVNVKNIAPKSTNKPMREIALLLGKRLVGVGWQGLGGRWWAVGVGW